jgi:hypothetical protein
MADPLLGYQLAMSSKTSVADSTSTTSGENKPEQKSKVEVLRYPYNLKIDRDTDYLEIRIADYQPPGISLPDVTLSEKDANGKQSITDVKLPNIADISTGTKSNQISLANPKAYIYLPIPQSISDSTSVSWGPDTLDPLAAFGVSLGTAAISREQSARDIIAKLPGAFSGALQSESLKNAFVAAVAGNAYGALGGNVSVTSLISRASGQVFNPNLELLFNGVNLRSFPFTFDFAPRNSTEARIVKQIIREFKKAMTAKSSSQAGSGGIFIKSPDVFQLTYKRGSNSHPFLNKFKPVALTDMQLNYTGSNTYATYADGTPVHIQMTLTFTELNPVYNDDYDTEMGKEGVGF